MAISQITTLTANLPEINEGVFKELVKDLVSNSVNGDNSPFSEVRSLLSEELANAVDLDANQRVGIYADFLKDSFAEINKQSMATALDLLKTNEELKLKAYSTEADYNKTMQEFANLGLQEEGFGKDNLIKDEQLIEYVEKIRNAKLAGLDALAKLRKQYGYANATAGAVLPDAVANAFTDLIAVLEAELATLSSPADDVRIAEINSELADINGILTNTVPSLGASTNDGALDKQIAGYDKVNNKDVMKSMSELTSMIYNAGDPVPNWVINMMQDNAVEASEETIDNVDRTP